MSEHQNPGEEHTTIIPRSESDANENEDFSFENWQRYQVLDFLGGGATSKVYKAIDRTLNRKVALKFIWGEDSTTEKRFIREARTQAQIDHPHVCKIHEVGNFSGRPYIAMQLIEGETLGSASSKMTLEQKVVVMKQVSDAIQAAHRLGIIHRDIKPANIMVEKTEGGWHSYVLDFGLARETAVEGVTLTGMILGTPAYMSPEQAWGDVQKIDRRSDVYGIGATCYFVFSGRPPFDGGSMEIILKLARDDPDYLRKVSPQIPMDLETIVMKCLEKDADHRYDSAKAVAEDLQHYLNGDSIQARPPSFIYTASKKIRKHKTLAIVLAVSAILVSSLAGTSIYSWWRTGKQIQIANEFAHISEEMNWRMRVARMAHLHNLADENKQVIQMMNAIRKRMQEAGKFSEAPGNYALGRGFMELSKFDEAKIYLEKAWNSGYQTPQNAYALGLTLGHLYQQELEWAQAFENPTQRKTRIKEIEQKYREPALNFLRRSHGSRSESEEYAEGLIAFYEKKYGDALQKAARARKNVWWLYEAEKLEGDIWMSEGIEEFDRANYDAAIKKYNAAGDAYKNAIQTARNDPSLYESDCMRWLKVLLVESARGRSLKEPMDQGLAACDLALTADPDRGTAYSKKAEIWWRYGEDAYYKGTYPQEAVDNSIRFAEAAIQRNNQDYNALFELGNAYGLKAEFEQTSNLDGTQSWNKSIEYYKKVIPLQPNFPNVYSTGAISYIALAQNQIAHGSNPRANLNQAIQDCEKAAKLAPDSVAAFNTLGTAYIILAEYERRHGLNAAASIQHAADALNKATAVSPKHPVPYENLATVYYDRARDELNTGLNPWNSVQQSIASAEKTLELGGDAYPTAYSIAARALTTEAQYKVLMGESPDELIAQSNEKLLNSLKLGSNEPLTVYTALLNNYFTQADFEIDKKADPSAALQNARKIYQKAADELHDNSLEIWNGKLEILRAKWQIQNSQLADISWHAADDSLKNALKQNSEDTFLFITAAELMEVKAEWLNKKGEPFDGEFSRGLSYIEKALKINPKEAEALILQGKFYQLKNSQDLANQSFQKAFAINLNLKRKYQ
jgi:eukaryotic-like serine/threonine-protein kinase